VDPHREPRPLSSGDARHGPPKLPNRRWLSWGLVATGIALLLYTGAQYWKMYSGQQQLKSQWQQQAAVSASTRQPAGPVLTRLRIPKISLDAIVAEGTSPKALLEGPGHLEETALPGEQGNAVIAGHRDTFFRHIFELSAGDEIMVERNGQTFRYEVTGKKIINPDDTSVIAPSRGSQLTLITCYPPHYIGPAPERFAVFSKLRP